MQKCRLWSSNLYGNTHASECAHTSGSQVLGLGLGVVGHVLQISRSIVLACLFQRLSTGRIYVSECSSEVVTLMLQSLYSVFQEYMLYSATSVVVVYLFQNWSHQRKDTCTRCAQYSWNVCSRAQAWQMWSISTRVQDLQSYHACSRVQAQFWQET